MSKFNKYAQQLDEIARKAFSAYKLAETTYNRTKEDEERIPKYINNMPDDVEQVAKRARVHADFIEAQEAFRKAKMDFASHIDDITYLRQELAKELAEAFAVDPAKLNATTLELLKSNILTAYEYNKLMREAIAADNTTMARIIAKYSNEAAQAAEKSGDIATASDLRKTAILAKQYNGDMYLQEFDQLSEVLTRTINNPSMIRYWDSLTAEMVENF